LVIAGGRRAARNVGEAKMKAVGRLGGAQGRGRRCKEKGQRSKGLVRYISIPRQTVKTMLPLPPPYNGTAPPTYQLSK